MSRLDERLSKRQLEELRVKLVARLPTGAFKASTALNGGVILAFNDLQSKLLEWERELGDGTNELLDNAQVAEDYLTDCIFGHLCTFALHNPSDEIVRLTEGGKFALAFEEALFSSLPLRVSDASAFFDLLYSEMKSAIRAVAIEGYWGRVVLRGEDLFIKPNPNRDQFLTDEYKSLTEDPDWVPGDEPFLRSGK